jgi:hypothetical protein
VVSVAAVVISVAVLAALAVSAPAARATTRTVRRPSVRAARSAALPVADMMSKRMYRARWQAPPGDPTVPRDALGFARLDTSRYRLSGVFSQMYCNRYFRANDRFCIAVYHVTYVRRSDGTSAGGGSCGVGVTVYRTRRGLRTAPASIRRTGYCLPYPDTDLAYRIGGLLGAGPVVVHPAPGSLPTPVLPSGLRPPVTDGSAPPAIADTAQAMDLNTDLGAYVGYQGPYYAAAGFWFYVRWYDFRGTVFYLNARLAYVAQFYYAYNGYWYPWMQQNLIQGTCQGGTGWDWAQTVATC